MSDTVAQPSPAQNTNVNRAGGSKKPREKRVRLFLSMPVEYYARMKAAQKKSGWKRTNTFLFLAIMTAVERFEKNQQAAASGVSPTPGDGPDADKSGKGFASNEHTPANESPHNPEPAGIPLTGESIRNLISANADLIQAMKSRVEAAEIIERTNALLVTRNCELFNESTEKDRRIRELQGEPAYPLENQTKGTRAPTPRVDFGNHPRPRFRLLA